MDSDNAIQLPRLAVVAGGTESMSQVPMLVSKKAKVKLMAAGRAKTQSARLRAYAPLRPSDLKPVFGNELGLTDQTSSPDMG